jgi:two-component system, chemotaxis family, CheB/CheR fusion protein
MNDPGGGQPSKAKDSLEFAESIIDTVREPLLILDAQLRVRSANRSFYQTFAVDPEDTENRLIYELGNGQWNIPRLRTLLEEILPKDHTFRDLEVDHVFENVGRRRMLLNARKIWREGNHSELILLAIEDITNLWRAEVELKDSRERYRLIVESATAYGIFTMDMQGIVTTWNPGAMLIFGYQGAEIIGRDIRVVFTPEDRELGMADVEMRTAEAEGRALDERWHLRKNGERFWANGVVMPLKDDADQTRGFLKILRDMSEQQQLENSLRQRSADLEKADENKNEFLAMLAHELRNPLAAVRNALSIVTHTDAKEDVEWCYDVINRQLENFGIIIDDLLDVARLSQGKIQLRPEILDAARVIHQALETVKPVVSEKNHAVTLSFKSLGLYLSADPTRLEQILVNLIANAAKYTPPGGRIEVIAGVEADEVVIRIRDNGIGISSEMLPRLFDLFSQADR